MTQSVLVTATVRTYPRLPYDAIKNEILGSSYELSLAFVGERRARTINERVRKQSYVPNVLSIPLDTTHGEIIITPARAKVEASRYNLSPRGYIGFLYIHGLLHLKGLAHGDRMTALEARYLRRYNLR